MTEPIDHAAEAREALLGAGDGRNFATDASNNAIAHAVLALVAAQDRANELKRIEVLAILAKTEQADIADVMDGPGGARPSILSGQAGAALFDWDGDLAPSVAAALGLGGESDGE